MHGDVVDDLCFEVDAESRPWVDGSIGEDYVCGLGVDTAIPPADA